MSFPYGELRYVSPQDLHTVWSLIKPGIEKVRKHSSDDWVAEDIFTAIRQGSSYLYVAYVNGYAGFLIVTPIQGYSTRTMNIWLGFNASRHDVIGLFWEDIERIAENMQASRITFVSPRKGFARRMKQYGFKSVQVVYERTINGIKKPLDHHAKE